MLAVGKPSVRPRSSPCSTRPSTAKGWPSSRAASSGLARLQRGADRRWRKSCRRRCRDRVEHRRRRSLPSRPYRTSSAASPARPLPKRKSAPTTTQPASSPFSSTSKTKSCGPRFAISSSKASANIASTPSAAIRRALARNGVRRNGSPPGRKYSCGRRLENQNGQRRAAFFRQAAGLADQGAVAQMHAVEIADGDDGALIGLRHVGDVTEDAHGRVKLPGVRAR